MDEERFSTKLGTTLSLIYSILLKLVDNSFLDLFDFFLKSLLGIV